jgi:multidrug resistance efflux pump
MKKPILLGIVFILLAGVLGGFAYFEYVMKPEIIKKAVLGAPQPTPSVVSEAAGIIQSIGFESGQEVDAGDLLVELDDGTEQASLKAAQAQLRNSQANLKR